MRVIKMKYYISVRSKIIDSRNMVLIIRLNNRNRKGYCSVLVFMHKSQVFHFSSFSNLLRGPFSRSENKLFTLLYLLQGLILFLSLVITDVKPYKYEV